MKGYACYPFCQIALSQDLFVFGPCGHSESIGAAPYRYLLNTGKPVPLSALLASLHVCENNQILNVLSVSPAVPIPAPRRAGSHLPSLLFPQQCLAHDGFSINSDLVKLWFLDYATI